MSFIFFAIPSFAQFVPNRYTVVLADPPVSSRFATREDLVAPAAVSYRQQIEAKQAALKRNLEGRNIHVTGSVSTLMNAIFVTAPSSRVAEIEALPGVIAVKPMRRFKPTLNRATQAMNAQVAWNAVGGVANAGAGIKIGIIDTGIDQTHPAFQDPSLKMPAGYPLCTTGHPEDCAYTTNKVIVARSYVRDLALAYVTDPKNPAAQSQPDDYSPRDRFGHGTTVAACAAAFTATGPAVGITSAAVSINGMAPKAFLGNYKIEGSPGINDYPTDDLLIRAVEDAVLDGMDVVSLSFGGLATSDAASDPVAAAYEAAAQKIVVVLAAGNDGDTTYNNGGAYPYFGSISSPGTAPSAITVGATMNSHVFIPTVGIAASGAPSKLKGITAVIGDSLIFGSGAVAAPLVDVTKLGDNGLGCGTFPAGSLTGTIALIERGTCSFDLKAIAAQTAGAVGVIFYMADSSALISPSSISNDFLGPTVMVSNADGTALKQYIDSNPGQSVTIDISGAEQDLATFSSVNSFSPPLATNQLASYSSVGPTPDGNIKPDLVATGGSDPQNGAFGGLYMPTQSFDPTLTIGYETIYSSNGFVGADGTSYSTPITAGAAALIKQAHPNFTPAQIKSALVNSAAHDTTSDDVGVGVDVESIGAGRLDVGAAIGAVVTAAPSTISFGILKAGGTLPSKTVTLTNKGSGAVTLAASVSAGSTVAGTSVTVSPQSITLQAGASGSLTVSITGSVPGPGEYSGRVILTGSGTTLSLPYMVLVGSGTASNFNFLSTVAAAFPGQDGGPYIVQVTDQYGVPVAGSAVTFSEATRGSVTLQSYGFGEPACTPATSTATISCPTDQFGFAYVEVIVGSSIGSYTVNATVVGQRVPLTADVLDPAAQPAITQSGVVNGATFQSAIAPGSYITIKGVNLLDTNQLSNFAFYNNLNYELVIGDNLMSNGALPLSLDFTSVTFDVPSAGISVPGYLYFVSPTQVNVYVPWELAGQSSVQVKVNTDEYTWGNVVTVPISTYAPGFFMNTGNVADALDLSQQLITAGNPAVRGQTIQLFANGLGPVNNQPASGSPASTTTLSSTKTTPVVTIGGQPATVSFSGLTPGSVGLYQVNVQVPAGVATGNQPITISIGGATSPATTAGGQQIMIPVK